MKKYKIMRTIINEYGFLWVINRGLYSFKLKGLKTVPFSECLYRKKVDYCKKLNLFEIDVIELKEFIGKLSNDDKEKLIRMADKACEGKIIGFSTIELDYGKPMDWQLNPLTGIRCDESKKWYIIPDFDKTRGDIKIVWEASRFSHFITLARAYLLTGNIKYYMAFSSQLNEWLLLNRYGYGANYKCGQECSLRMVNALLAYTIFEKCEVATDKDKSNVRDLVDRCYRKILENFFYSYKCIKNNHTISELMGMLIGAWCSEDERYIEKACTLLTEVIEEQFTEDGGYKQFSFNYQRLVLQDLECILSIYNQIGKELSIKCKNRIKNAALLMYQCQEACGDLPNYGNNDGALVFPVSSCDYRDFRAVINTVYTLITGEQLFDPDKHQEEILWFSNGKHICDYKIKKVERVSSNFEKAGLFTLRNKDSWMMIVANDYKSRPAHMDQHHIDLWIHGINVFCDSGTYSYACDIGHELVKNKSHNTVVVDGVNQMNFRGSFMIFNWTRRELLSFTNTSFSSEVVSANGYKHKREVKQMCDSYQIIDDVDKDCKILFHTPCEVRVDGNKSVLLKDGVEICEMECTEKIEVIEACRSLFYLRKEKANCLSINCKAGITIKTNITYKEKEKKND